MSVNSWIDGKVLDLLQACGVELPGGDGDALRADARAWDTMADELTAIARAIDTSVSALDREGWHGEARDAFEKRWQQQKAAIDRIATNLHQVAEGLRAYADEIDGINESIIDICVQIAEFEVAGAALSFFTGFVSDLVADTAVARYIERVVDLVKLFTQAAEKVAALIERFYELSEETTAALTAAAKVAAEVTAKGAETFASNFVADTGSAMAEQALSGQPVTVGADLKGGATAAVGTTLFAVGGAQLADSAGIGGVAGDILKGDGLLGTTLNGAAGNVAGGLAADTAGHRDLTTIGEDALANAASGAAGNAQNHGIHAGLEQHGSLGGENISPHGRRKDAAFTTTVDTTMNTGVYAQGSGIESDVEALVEDEKMANGTTP